MTVATKKTGYFWLAAFIYQLSIPCLSKTKKATATDRVQNSLPAHFHRLWLRNNPDGRSAILVHRQQDTGPMIRLYVPITDQLETSIQDLLTKISARQSNASLDTLRKKYEFAIDDPNDQHSAKLVYTLVTHPNLNPHYPNIRRQIAGQSIRKLVLNVTEKLSQTLAAPPGKLSSLSLYLDSLKRLGVLSYLLHEERKRTTLVGTGNSLDGWFGPKTGYSNISARESTELKKVCLLVEKIGQTLVLNSTLLADIRCPSIRFAEQYQLGSWTKEGTSSNGRMPPILKTLTTTLGENFIQLSTKEQDNSLASALVAMTPKEIGQMQEGHVLYQQVSDLSREMSLFNGINTQPDVHLLASETAATKLLSTMDKINRQLKQGKNRNTHYIDTVSDIILRMKDLFPTLK